jgi:predicted GNAT superfamily acetyltransferase
VFDNACYTAGVIPDYHIKDLTDPFEMDALEDVQLAAWGYQERDITPGSLFTVHSHLGGVVCAAYEGDLAVGFAYGFPALYKGRLVHHSHQLAIRPEHRKSGLARRLKLHQRERALELGFELMTWTFDPLLTRNARLNLGKLGAKVVSYHANWYALRGGIYAGLPADRFFVEWALHQPSLEHETPKPKGVKALEARADTSAGEPDLTLEHDCILVESPRDIDALKAKDLAVAATWREAHRIAFPHYFESGYIVTDLCDDGTRTFYQLQRNS